MGESRVGFSGTRNGMTPPQARSVAELLSPYGWLHHGDCIGPAGLTESGGGTWATARYARKIGKPVTLVLPDGSCVKWGT